MIKHSPPCHQSDRNDRDVDWDLIPFDFTFPIPQGMRVLDAWLLGWLDLDRESNSCRETPKGSS